MENISLTLDQEQAAQSQRTRESTQRIMGEALQKLSSPLSTDAPSRTDAALPEPSVAARVAGDEVLLYTAARSRLGKGRALDEYMKGVADGVQLAKNQLIS